MTSFFLASGSPRRSEILDKLQIPHVVYPVEADERLDTSVPPEQAGEILATRKAIAAKNALLAEDRLSADTVILAADTLVYLDGKPLGKPHSAEDAAAMLRALRGRKHIVCTGICMLRGTRSVSTAEVTEVQMRAYSDAEIDAYVATGEPLDKAGAYGIQGIGAVLVERIEGDFFNVMGLPPKAVSRAMNALGIPYFAWIKER